MKPKPDPSGVFTEEEIAQANRRHDRDYGWSMEIGNLYTNPFRHRHTVTGPIQQVWERQNGKEQP